MKSHADHNASKGKFQLVFSFEPLRITAGEPVQLSFKPLESEGHKSVNLEAVHEKYMHLLIISEDLSYFSHEHPHQVNDAYVHEHRFPNGGKYVLFVDYSPQGDSQQISRHELNLEGKPAEIKSLPLPQTEWNELGYKLSFSKDQPPIKAGTVTNLSLHVEKEGTPVRDLDQYLGALAHVVIISEDTQEYLHVHPIESRESGPEVNIHTSFPHPGKYKMFVQFSHSGKIRTASFVLEVL